MSDNHQPIKRSKELAPLSREHHEGLLFSWKVRQGIKFCIEPERVASYCQWFWQTYLNLHFHAEEQQLPPVLSSSHPLIKRMFEEHESIKSCLQKVSSTANYEDLEQVAQLIVDHIRFEERILFNEIERTATANQLQKVAEALKEEKSCNSWKDQFWIHQ